MVTTVITDSAPVSVGVMRNTLKPVRFGKLGDPRFTV